LNTSRVPYLPSSLRPESNSTSLQLVRESLSSFPVAMPEGQVATAAEIAASAAAGLAPAADGVGGPIVYADLSDEQKQQLVEQQLAYQQFESHQRQFQHQHQQQPFDQQQQFNQQQPPDSAAKIAADMLKDLVKWDGSSAGLYEQGKHLNLLRAGLPDQHGEAVLVRQWIARSSKLITNPDVASLARDKLSTALSGEGEIRNWAQLSAVLALCTSDRPTPASVMEEVRAYNPRSQPVAFASIFYEKACARIEQAYVRDGQDPELVSFLSSALLDGEVVKWFHQTLRVAAPDKGVKTLFTAAVSAEERGVSPWSLQPNALFSSRQQQQQPVLFADDKHSEQQQQQQQQYGGMHPERAAFLQQDNFSSSPSDCMLAFENVQSGNSYQSPTRSSPSREMCRDFGRGTCTRINCRFQHVPEQFSGKRVRQTDSGWANSSQNEVCRHFRDWGNCRFGDDCRLSHGQKGSGFGQGKGKGKGASSGFGRGKYPRTGKATCYNFRDHGTCRFGDDCGFNHEVARPKDDSVDQAAKIVALQAELLEYKKAPAPSGE
jgi:hypothetical protein